MRWITYGVLQRHRVGLWLKIGSSTNPWSPTQRGCTTAFFLSWFILWELACRRNSFPYLIETIEYLVALRCFFFFTAAACLIINCDWRHILWFFRLLWNAAIVGLRRSGNFQLTWGLPDSEHLRRAAVIVVRGISHGIYIKAQQVNKACQYYWEKSLLDDPLLLTSSSIYIFRLYLLRSCSGRWARWTSSWRRIRNSHPACYLSPGGMRGRSCCFHPPRVKKLLYFSCCLKSCNTVRSMFAFEFA